jgi:hypothetical protein
LKVNDVKSRIRIQDPDPDPGSESESGSTPKCHGSATLLPRNKKNLAVFKENIFSPLSGIIG